MQNDELSFLVESLHSSSTRGQEDCPRISTHRVSPKRKSGERQTFKHFSSLTRVSCNQRRKEPKKYNFFYFFYFSRAILSFQFKRPEHTWMIYSSTRFTCESHSALTYDHMIIWTCSKSVDLLADVIGISEYAELNLLSKRICRCFIFPDIDWYPIPSPGYLLNDTAAAAYKIDKI